MKKHWKWGLLALGVLALGVPSKVSPPQLGEGPLYAKPGQQLEWRVTGVPWWVQSKVDNQAVQVERDLGRFLVNLPADLAEGPKKLEVEVGGLFPQHLHLELMVDSTPPKLQVLQPAPDLAVQGTTLEVRGRSEAGAEVSLGQGWQPAGESFRLPVSLKPGWNVLKVRARDRADNESALDLRVFADTQAPQVALQRGKEALRGKTQKQDSFRVQAKVSDDGGVDRVRYRIDQSKWLEAPLQEGEAELVLRNLPEGSRQLEVEVRDRAGRLALERCEFVVDSTEKLGKKALTLGARGKDVEALQQRLSDAGQSLLISGEFDAATEFAVRAFQEAEHLPVTGKVAQATLTALGPRIVVNLGRFELVLDRPGQENRRFTIACGAPQFPTPTGKFVVYDMVKDPTWIPPDSPWAKEAKTIPPGPDNPLGTRWIGLDWGGVGIHGTNADWTIGSASSHGCVRMHISEVEELYELVQPGTPVTILGGWEEDPLKQRYWPQ
jgi:hypothetical protein